MTHGSTAVCLASYLSSRVVSVFSSKSSYSPNAQAIILIHMNNFKKIHHMKNLVCPGVCKDNPLCISFSVKSPCTRFHCHSQPEIGPLFHRLWEDRGLSCSIYQSHCICILLFIVTPPSPQPLSVQNYPHQQCNHSSPAIQLGWVASISLLLQHRQSKTAGPEWYVKDVSKFSPWVGRGVRC